MGGALGPSAKYPPPHPLAAPEGRGNTPRVLTQYQKLRLLTAAGMEGPSGEAVMGMEEKDGACLAAEV